MSKLPPSLTDKTAHTHRSDSSRAVVKYDFLIIDVSRPAPWQRPPLDFAGLAESGLLATSTIWKIIAHCGQELPRQAFGSSSCNCLLISVPIFSLSKPQHTSDFAFRKRHVKICWGSWFRGYHLMVFSWPALLVIVTCSDGGK